jgi:hypothetical protein
MGQTKSRFFSIMVVGDNPTTILEKYDMTTKVEPYVKYKYLYAEKYKNTAIKILEKLFSEADKIPLSGNVKETLKERLKTLKNTSNFEYYKSLTEGLYYDEEGNALSEENPNGKFRTFRLGRNFALPLILNNGKETYSAKCSEINWSAMHLVNQDVYRRAWEIVVDGDEPKTEEEKMIKSSMENKQAYFSNFKSKEDYVTYSTAYWNYAFVDKDGWVDVNDCGDEQKWIETFYEKFVSNLKPDDTVSIYECSINEDN